jgi:hypothetical protein
MFVNEIYWGLLPDNFPKVTAIENKMGYDSMVHRKRILMFKVIVNIIL